MGPQSGCWVGGLRCTSIPVAAAAAVPSHLLRHPAAHAAAHARAVHHHRVGVARAVVRVARRERLLRLLLLLRHRLLLLPLLLDQRVELIRDLAHSLHHEGHRKVVQVVAPGELHHDVGPQLRVARVERRGKARVELLLHEEVDELLGDGRVARLGRRLDGLVPHLVLLGQLHRLGPLLRALVEHGADAAELQQRVLLAHLRHLDLVEVVEGDDALGERLVVLVLDVQRVERVVHLLDVCGLRRKQVRLHERQVARALHL
mmetsp:Transcript_18986/g.56254  ORF Transcript_18986/g.56254 Transcript_18986/m.56254 type:complete len:260 (+) Transcript_18986:138-917(+)